MRQFEIKTVTPATIQSELLASHTHACDRTPAAPGYWWSLKIDATLRNVRVHLIRHPNAPSASVGRSTAPAAAPSWDRIEREFNGALDALWGEIAPHMPEALSRPGRVRTARFPLHVYRTFYRGDLDEEDPIVAGIQIKDEGDLFRVTADVGGEESGSILYSNTIFAAKTSERLIDAVRRALAGLRATGGIIEEALRAVPE